MALHNMTFANDYFQHLALYNRWANNKLYDVVASLPEADYVKDMGVYFRSVHDTLSHILVGDLIWTGRLANQPYAVQKLDHVPHDHFKDLRAAREALDATIIRLMADLHHGEMARPFSYNDITNTARTLPLSIALGHLFNHQTHHRGQVHGMLSQLGVEPPSIDLVYFALEQIETEK